MDVAAWLKNLGLGEYEAETWRRGNGFAHRHEVGVQCCRVIVIEPRSRFLRDRLCRATPDLRLQLAFCFLLPSPSFAVSVETVLTHQPICLSLYSPTRASLHSLLDRLMTGL